MCLLTLSSTNSDFSYIIYKNPETGMILKKIRQGIGYGFYANETKYVVYFKDQHNEMSYKENKDDHFEYLNVLRYTSPLFVLNAINEFFSSAMKGNHKSGINDEQGYTNNLFINSCKVKNKNILNYFDKFFPKYKLNYKLKNEITGFYEIEIETEQSIEELLNYSYVLFTTIVAVNRDYFDITDNLIEKSIIAMNKLDVPYYIKHMFVCRVMYSNKCLIKFRNLIQECRRYELKLEYGNTREQRKNFISSNIMFDKDIIDVGCGKGFYAIRFSKKIKDKKYYAIDIDKEKLQKLERIIDKHEIKNIETFNSVYELIINIDLETVYDILITEVIEHMKPDQSKKLLIDILKKIKFSTLVVTTPDKNFNKYFELDIEFRHDDHEWEPDRDEFKEFMEDVFEGAGLDKKKLKIEYLLIGDTIKEKDGSVSSVSQALVLTKN